jgi:F-type H+-transporting ATPase subunit epsilon
MPIPTHLRLEIVTPDRHVVHDQVDEVEVPGSEGYFGVLPGHTPMMAALTVGELWYRKGQEKEYLSIAFGFAEVLPDKVTILAQLAERAAEIDRERAEEARKRAEAQLTDSKAGADYAMARASLMKALTRLQVSQRIPAGRVGRPRMPNVQ